MTTILIEVTGLDAAISVAGRLRTWKLGLHRPLARLLKLQHEHRVNVEKTDPSGRPWEPLKPYTIAKKERQGNHDAEEILVDTHALAGNFKVSTSGDIIRLRNPAAYTLWLQKGTSGQDGSVRMIARPFLGISNRNIKEIRHLVVRHIASRVTGEI